MQIKPLSSDFAVSAQILPEDVPQIADSGYRTIINHRPDGESADQPPGDTIAASSSSEGLAYQYQPVISGALTLDDVDEFSHLMDKAEKPVLAFCRSGTRCTTLWALSQAGKLDTNEIIDAAARAGYDLAGLRGQIDSLAQQRKG